MTKTIRAARAIPLSGKPRREVGDDGEPAETRVGDDDGHVRTGLHGLGEGIDPRGLAGACGQGDEEERREDPGGLSHPARIAPGDAPARDPGRESAGPRGADGGRGWNDCPTRDRVNILVTGVTGYIGSQLVPELLAAGHRVRCLARNPAKIPARLAARVEVFRGDAFDPASLGPALRGCDVAYYLIHSMDASAGEFAERDRAAARNFASAASAAGVWRASSTSAASVGTRAASPSTSGAGRRPETCCARGACR